MKCYVYLEFIYVFEGLMVDIGCWFFGYFWWKMVFNLILIRYKVIFFYNIKLKIYRDKNKYCCDIKWFFFIIFIIICNVVINIEKML